MEFTKIYTSARVTKFQKENFVFRPITTIFV